MLTRETGEQDSGPFRVERLATRLGWVSNLTVEEGLSFIATGGISAENVGKLVGKSGVVGFGASVKPDPAVASEAITNFLAQSGLPRLPGLVPAQADACIILGANYTPEVGLIRAGQLEEVQSKWDTRGPHTFRDFHYAPEGETHVLTVFQGTVTIGYCDADGLAREFTIGEGQPHQIAAIRDWKSGAGNAPGHWSKAGPNGLGMVVRIFKDSHNPLAS